MRFCLLVGTGASLDAGTRLSIPLVGTAEVERVLHAGPGVVVLQGRAGGQRVTIRATPDGEVVDAGHVAQQLGIKVPSAVSEAGPWQAPGPRGAAVAVDSSHLLGLLESELLGQAEAQGFGAWDLEAKWHGPSGFGTANRVWQYNEKFLRPLARGLSGIKVSAGQVSCDGTVCGTTGVISGIHSGKLLEAVASGAAVDIPFGMQWQVADGKIKEAWTVLDTLSLHSQISGLEAAKFDNACLTDEALNPPTPDAPRDFLPHCPSFIINTTDSLWEGPLDDLPRVTRTFFDKGWQSNAMGGVIKQKDMLGFFQETRGQMPGCKIIVRDLVCSGNDIDGYKAILAYVFQAQGAAVNGMVMWYLQRVEGRWTYMQEWLYQDNAAMSQQLGQAVPPAWVSPVPQRCSIEQPSWTPQPGLAATAASWSAPATDRGFSNQCLNHGELVPPTRDAPREFLGHCASWLVRATDALWHGAVEDIDGAVDEFFAKGWNSETNHGSTVGAANLKDAVRDWRAAFPDLQIHVLDSYCMGNDVDGYKAAMPDRWVGTHTGPSRLFGKPTGRRAVMAGVAVSRIMQIDGKWKFTSEWTWHDWASLYQQLGVELPTVEKAATAACEPVFTW
mmetsp:Transcript_109083/g.250189  ORF Transcript_109083/g.250189 Transcript_109083/m.250189 type:complete len:615 (+) Transcript_109083:29-1873(+)